MITEDLATTHLGLLFGVLEAKGQQMDVRRLLPVHGARVDGLRKVLVDAVRRLVIHRRVTLFQRPLKFLRHFILRKRSNVDATDDNCYYKCYYPPIHRAAIEEENIDGIHRG